MDWRDYCIDEMAKHRCFISALHKKRFIEMVEMVRYEPFFTREIAKCVFLAAWQRPSTDEMEAIFRELMDGGTLDAKKLEGRRKYRIVTPNEREIFNLAKEFLENPGQTPDESCLIRLSKAWIPLGDSALQVSEIIDSL